jgi:uncharacterized protein (DUF1330 family)
MSAYVVSRVAIIDTEQMDRYLAEVPAIVERYGGKYLVRGRSVVALEGTWDHDRMVVVEFPDTEAALAWYHSEAYRPLRDLRQRSAAAVILLADGIADVPA